MFATGIENSIPTINHGKTRVDEMEVCGHYDRWREDFDCVQEIGINYLRYGPPIHKTYLGPNKFDWEFADLTFAELKKRDITPIVDLCHFGVPDWIGNFQNPDWPPLFAQYAEAFAQRFDGFSIGSNDLTQLTLGVDRDSAELASLFDERNEAVRWMIREVIERAHRAGAKVSLCGEAPSVHPEYAGFLVECGIDAMSVSPDSFIAVKRHVAQAEAPNGSTGDQPRKSMLSGMVR